MSLNQINAPGQRGGRIRVRGLVGRYQNQIAILAIMATVVGTMVVRPYSVLMFTYFFALWAIFMAAVHKRELRDFCLAFPVNSVLIAIFYIVQTTVYPTTYGTTSPLGSWTDDSYFFALIADNIPPGIILRENYYLYSDPFASILKFLTLPAINHPMDIIFFQSGTSAILATFTKKFAIQLSGNDKVGNMVFWMAVLCPFLMMNGGAILLRDTLSAAVLIYSLSCLHGRRYVPAFVAVGLHLLIRPGTAVALLPAYGIVLFLNRKLFSRANTIFFLLCIPVLMVAMVRGFLELGTLPQYAHYLQTMSLQGREVYADLTDDDTSQFFLMIQQLPFIVKFFMSGAYMFLYPFLDPKGAFATPYFDFRTVVLTLVAPVYGFWTNAGFFAGLLAKRNIVNRQKQIAYAVIVTLLILGTYSLETRHKTILYPLYYIVVASGFIGATRNEKSIAYVGSFILILIQLAFVTF